MFYRPSSACTYVDEEWLLWRRLTLDIRELAVLKFWCTFDLIWWHLKAVFVAVFVFDMHTKWVSCKCDENTFRHGFYSALLWLNIRWRNHSNKYWLLWRPRMCSAPVCAPRMWAPEISAATDVPGCTCNGVSCGCCGYRCVYVGCRWASVAACALLEAVTSHHATAD